jgi:hypothetical protein
MPLEPYSANLYVAQTRTSATDIFWRPFCRLNDEKGWGFMTNETKKVATHPNGAWLLCAGADDRRELDKRRGTPWRRVRIDECGAHRPSYLEYLVEQVIQPRLMDQDGDLWLMGTPSIQAFGFFFEVTTGKRKGWSNHKWTVKQNPHIDWRKFIYDPVEGILALRGWTEDHPIFRREYLAEWEVDADALVYRFARARNVVPELPPLQQRHDRWVHVLGLDFGVGDACAAALLAYPELYGNDVYVVKVWSQSGLAPSQAAAIIVRDFVEPFDPDIIVGDVGGIGKAFQAEWNLRFPGIEMKAAKKTDKRTAIEIVSDALFVANAAERRGLFSLEGNDALHDEWATLLWDEKREDIAEGQQDNIANAAQYAYRECPAFENACRPPREDPRPAHVREDDEDEQPQAHYLEVSEL